MTGVDTRKREQECISGFLVCRHSTALPHLSHPRLTVIFRVTIQAEYWQKITGIEGDDLL